MFVPICLSENICEVITSHSKTFSPVKGYLILSGMYSLLQAYYNHRLHNTVAFLIIRKFIDLLVWVMNSIMLTILRWQID